MAQISSCVDCGLQNARYYSYKYKASLCKNCSEVHDVILNKRDECNWDQMLRRSKTFDCLSIHSEEREAFLSNQELELFLPDFYQKCGQDTPLVIRKEFIMAKYVDKLFTSPAGVNTLLPPTKVGVLLKKRSVNSGWRPCYVKLDKRESILEYFNYKSSKMIPKGSIDMKSVEIFVERMPREKSEEGKFYLHLIWNKGDKELKNPYNKIAVYARRKFTQFKEAKKPEEFEFLPHVRSLYFWPTTDTEFFQWYFALLSARFALLNTNTLKGFRYGTPLKRSASFDTSNVYCELDALPDESPRKIMFVPVSQPEPESVEMTPTEDDAFLLSNTDPLFHFPKAPIPNLVHRASCTMIKTKLDFSGSYCMDKTVNTFFISCRENPFSGELSHDDEIEVDTGPVAPKAELILDSSFYSCPPKKNTNPFIDSNRPKAELPERPVVDANTSPFKPRSDICIIEDSIYQLGSDNPTIKENFPETSQLEVSLDKESWISTPVRVSDAAANRLASVDSCPLDLQAEMCADEPIGVVAAPSVPENLYGSIRDDITLNRKLYFKSGWLSKVGEHRGDKWRARWFTLYNHHLTYSENEFSVFPNGQVRLDSDQKGFGVYFNTSTFKTIPPPTPHTFTITTPTRDYYLCALTEREQREWFEVISRVVALAYVLK